MSHTDASELLLGRSEEDVEDVSRAEIYRELLDLFVVAPLRVIWSDWRTRFGILIILGYLAMGTIGIWIVEAPVPSEGPRYLQPFDHQYTKPVFGIAPVTLGFLDWTYTGIWQFPFGTTNIGEDLFAKVVHATPPMLVMITAGAVVSTGIATVLGAVSGYKGGRADSILMYLTDVMMAIPGLPLIILLTAIFEPQSPVVVGVLLAIDAWPGLARAIRSQVLSLRDRPYVEASRIMDIPLHEIIADDVLPNIMPYVLISFVNGARGIVFGSVALYFIGVLPFSVENWGVMMNQAYSSGGALYTIESAHWLLAPMGAVILLSFGLILFAQGTERLFNPRIRARHADTTEGSIAAEDESTGESGGLSTW